jgi:hypothetical protein
LSDVDDSAAAADEPSFFSFLRSFLKPVSVSVSAACAKKEGRRKKTTTTTTRTLLLLVGDGGGELDRELDVQVTESIRVLVHGHTLTGHGHDEACALSRVA